MRKLARISCGAVMVWLLASPAPAATIDLFDYGFNVNGTVYSNSVAIPGFDASGFDTATGLGTFTLTHNATSAEVFYFVAFLDLEIDEALNTFFNEYGSTANAPAAGESWEIDEPGYVFGNIYGNFVAGALDNANAVPAATPDDVSMALGWYLILNAGDIATLTFSTSTTAPGSGFYLVHTDPDSVANVYFSSTETVVPTGVPEPGTLTLFGLGLLLGARRLRRR